MESLYRGALKLSTWLTTKPEDANRASPRNTVTYRISGVPTDWDRQQLKSFLDNQESVADAVIESLAREHDGRSQVATATFGNLPSHLEDGPSWYTPIPNVSDANLCRKQYLTVGKDFHGLTMLYTPSSQHHKIDIIALSGLGGHAFGSFKEKGGSYMWLRDSLPHDLTINDQPIARVMIYGFESTVARSKSMQNLEDFAIQFTASLQTLVNTTTMQPIILIGHSLGGLIIKQALISLSRSENKDNQKLMQAIYGIVFFGTPHRGMDISSLIPMAGDGPNRFLLESLSNSNSQILDTQHRDFRNALGDKGASEVFCFYETLQSPTAQQDKFGDWKLTGPGAFLVARPSATDCRPWEDGAENICPINRTHSEMVKFKPNDPDYKIVEEKIEGLTRRALISRSNAKDPDRDNRVKYKSSTNRPYCSACRKFGHVKDDLHCYLCQEYGHYANAVHCNICDNEYGHDDDDPHCYKCDNEYGHDDDDPHCYKCHEYGHFIRDCPRW
ncbi:Alpha/Beta hydrolase protein [Trichoderma chlorosporum]